MFAPFCRIGFCGSRSLPDSAQPFVTSVVTAALQDSTAQIAVGCSVGADSLVLASVPFSSSSRLSVFAAFGPDGCGACTFSAVPAVLASAAAGASVMWWAGGFKNLPLKARLANRTAALVRYLAESPPGALFCFHLSPRSRGSLLACRQAARRGVSVFVAGVDLPRATPPIALPLLGRGSWSPVSTRFLPQEVEERYLIYEWLSPRKDPELFGEAGIRENQP